jgi:hypothetical protein
MRGINLAGGGGLEAHERVSLLTVAAGFRRFCLLTHIQQEEFPLATAALSALGVAKSRIDLGDTPLGIVLGYPKCCSDMDERTKAYDRSAALRLLIEAKSGDYAAVKAELASISTVLP